MNPDTPKTPQEEMETRLIALLLGELSEQEAAAWRAAIATNPELAKLHDRLQQTISLVREATAKVTDPATEPGAPLQLSEDRRERLLAHFKTVRPGEFAAPRRQLKPWLVPLAATAALVLLLGALAIPNFTRARNTAQANAILNNLRQLDSAKQQWALEHGKSDTDTPTFDDIKNYIKGATPPSVAGETYVLGKVGEPVLAEVEASKASRRLGRLPVEQTRQTDGRLLVQLSQGPQTAAVAEEAAKTALAFRTWGLDQPGAAPPESRGRELFDMALPQGGRPVSTRQKPEPTVHLTNTPAPKPAQAAPGAPPPQIVLPPQVESFGTLEVARIMEKQDLARDNLRLEVRHDDETRKGATAVAADEGQQRMFFERYGIASPQPKQIAPATPSTGQGISGKRVQISGQPGELRGDLTLTIASPPPPPAAGAALATNAVEPPAFAGRSISPETGLPLASERLISQSIALGEAVALLPDGRDPARGFNRVSGGGGGGAGGAGVVGGVPAAAQSVPGQAVAGDFIAGFEVASTLSPQPQKPQEAVPLPLGVVTVEPEGDKVPMLGDTPSLGRFYRKDGSGKLDEPPADAVTAFKPEVPRVRVEESPRRQPSSIVLPSVLMETAEAKDKASEANQQVQGRRVIVEPGKRADAGVRLGEIAWADYDNDGFAVHFSGVKGKDSEKSSVEVMPAQEGVRRLAETRSRPEAFEQEVLLKERFSPADLEDQPGSLKPVTNAPIPQPEIQTSENAFSTFSLNVSDVSFKLAAASLEKGQMPDPASIRSEEFINAFDYRDPEPQWDSASSLSAQTDKMPVPPPAPIAFAWERARYPFAHNRDLLRFSIKTGAVGRQAGRALNLTLLLDNSGSMERADRVHIISEALRVLAGQLQPQDKISIITFARTPRLWVDGASGTQAGEVAERVSGLTPQGGTNLEEAMNLAYQTALRHYAAGGINRVVLLTDGAANLGNVEPESLKQKVETHRKQGIALDCFGIGWEGFNDDLLEVLSRNGDGRYGFINSPEEAATEFAGQLAGALQVAASDVKVQVEFNPARVTAYRQIGYAKHQLTKEQFRDNTVDAAEIAAQEAGNALYTVEVNPAGEGPLCIVRVRFKFPGTVVYREHEWAVPYNGSAVSLEQASPAMRLAASASAFSEWLVASPFAAEVSPDALLGYLRGVPEIYGADARPKKLEWMIRQAKSIEGK